MSRTLFISDLHLDAARPDITRALADFLSNNTDCDSLYILGDLFEAWVGDDDDAPLAIEVAALLKQFSATGPKLFLMRGNRDFLLGDAFCKSTGAHFLPDPTVIDLYGEPTLLMHGDSLCTADTEYMAFRATARDPQWQASIMSKSLDERRVLAKQIRSMSQEANSNKAEDIMDVTPTEVARVMADAGVNRLIHGHTHRPTRHTIDSGERWVLGDWDSQGWFIQVNLEEINLNNFYINQ